jgi:hypothetical protein
MINDKRRMESRITSGEIRRWALIIVHWALLPVLFLVGCGWSEPASSTGVLPDTDALTDWTLSGEEVFDSENIYDLVNGQADAFFAYGFEQVTVRNYENEGGTMLSVEVWQLATPADAYGLFTTSVSGEPISIGNDGDIDPGRRLAFWQDRYYVHIRARQEVPDADLRGFSEAASAALPSGGARPALMNRFPTEGLSGRGAIFFHQEISIQNEVWLGSENLLGLNYETDGILGQYDVGGTTAWLLLVEYPNAEQASTGLAALENSQISDLVTADRRDNLLGAVFGEVNEAAANTLLTKVLQ